MKTGLCYAAVVLLHSPSSSHAIIAFNSRRKSKEHLLSFIWWCWKTVWKTPQHFSPVLTPHEWGNHYNCLFFFSPKDIKYCAQGESTHTRSRQTKAAVSAAKRAWHRQVLPMAVPWNALFCVSFLYVEKKTNNTMTPRNMSKTFRALCTPHRLHKGMPKFICD